MKSLTIAALALTLFIPGSAAAETRYGYETVDGLKIFFREAGDQSNPTIVMLHGFPSSSHQYRGLIDDLSDSYYVIAPDYPGFGASDFPAPDIFTYSFDNLADFVDTFLEQRGLTEYVLVLHDYGAPVGFRIATEHPERVNALLIQNGNAYAEGVSADAAGMLEALWQNRSEELEQSIIANAFSAPALQWQYTHGTRNPEGILPDNWLLDIERMQRPGQHEMHLDLFEDYKSNIEAYPAWQAYMREHQPPVLVTWGSRDAFFTVAGAEGYARDAEDMKIILYDTGHWPLEENGGEIAAEIRSFLAERDIK